MAMQKEGLVSGQILQSKHFLGLYQCEWGMNKKKSRIRETKNLLTDADSSTAAKKLLRGGGGGGGLSLVVKEGGPMRGLERIM